MEGTSTLADTLLDDLDDLSDVEEELPAESSPDGGKGGADAQETAEAQNDSLGVAGRSSKRRLLDDVALNKHLKTIRDIDSSKQSSLSRKEQEEQEHHLIVHSNKHLSHLADELAQAHRDLCATYKPKFPELEELLPNPVQYKNAVLVMGNEMDMTKVNDSLNEFLSSNQIITISVAGSTTSGRPLSADELQAVTVVTTYMDDIVKVQSELSSFVENRMEGLCPSICAIVGPATAAKLIGLAGGLAELSKIPSCNLQVLGQVKHSAASRAGFSSVASRPHQGVLVESELVRQCPKHLQKKALKTVAAKLALAARCDYVNVDTGRTRSAEMGIKFREEIEVKLSKWIEPDKAQTLKALPKPDLTTKKRRGGRKMRRMKERFEETALMKQANTRAFSSQAGEYGDDAMGLSLGLLDTTDASGAIRKGAEKRKERQVNTKASRKRAAQMSAGTTKSGLESSVVFTPHQGMELVDPNANEDRVREANRKWFSDSAGFESALPKK